ncbi:MAG: alpha/beta hydrolase-fold protein [Ferruginibacter sp.]|nr:alpha/beta hydrolase-fold protein [Ferruginibacter sp.]
MKRLSFCILFSCVVFANSFSQQFTASYSSAVFDKPFTGNVLVYLSKENTEPKNGSVGFDLFPCFSVFVKDVQPGQTIVIDDKAVSYPTALSDIERGDYYVQIVWDRNLGGRSICESPGNMFNPSIKISITKDIKKTYSIVATQLIPAVTEFKETLVAKELKVPSSLLSKFNGGPITIDAAVLLPKGYNNEPDKTFPVLFTVFGYGGDYHRYSGDTMPSPDLDSIPFIRVYLDGNCALGHSEYANSDNNGPWADALIKEFIPLLEKRYRCNGSRLLTGHSSGGWSVLWLQTHYPEVFAGCWSSSPDPVDFRNFQTINLYEEKNIFYKEDSSVRLVATVAGRIPWASMKNIYQMENVVYRGEQMHSFNAVFSKKGANGMPQSICNSKTGEIDAAVFSNWKNYDIALYLRNNWESLKSAVDGKVRISVGSQDNFLLNHAVTSLETQMKQLNSSFQFAYYPGDHFTLSTPAYRKEGAKFLKQRYLQWRTRLDTEKK